MPLYQPPLYLSPLEQAIDHHPLTVTPETSLADVMNLMRQLHLSCHLPHDSFLSGTTQDQWPMPDEAQASCVVVIEQNSPAKTPTIAGIFTERNVVRLIAKGVIDREGSLLEKIPISQVMSSVVTTLTESDEQDVFAALSLFRQHRIRHLPIVNEMGQLMGVLIRERIRHVLQPSNVFRLRRVAELMTTPITAPLTASLLNLAQLMSEHQTSCVVLTEHKELKMENPKNDYTSILHYSFQQPVGMITEYDIMLAQFAQLDLENTPAFSVMSTPLVYLKPSDSLWVAHKIMEQHQVQRLLVSGVRGELLGLVTQTSLLRVLDPTEMYRAVKQLQQSVYQLQAEKLELLQSRNAELEEQVRERTAKLHEQLQRERLLATIALRIHQSLNLEEILNAAVAEVRQFLWVDRVVIYRIESTQTGIVVAESVTPDWESILGYIILQTFVEEHIQETQHNQIYAVSDINKAHLHPDAIRLLESLQVKAYLIVPIVQDSQLWGMMCVHQCSILRQWQPSEMYLLQQLATQVAIAIQQAQLYQQVQNLNADLERQVQERTAQLQQKVQELQQLNILKDEFLSTVSHELRTPLTNMKMAIHMLKIAPNPERLQRYLEILEAECSRETEMINALLDLQRLEAASCHIDLESVDLSVWLPTAIEPFYSRAQDRQQILEVEYLSRLPVIHSSSANLGRILAELLNNACKYTPNGGMICMKVDQTKESKNPGDKTHFSPGTSQVQFVIKNQAEIPETELPHIFEKFYRVPNADPWKQGGTGLGLALVQKLVEQLQGIIQVESSKGWTTFTVVLPT